MLGLLFAILGTAAETGKTIFFSRNDIKSVPGIIRAAFMVMISLLLIAVSLLFRGELIQTDGWFWLAILVHATLIAPVYALQMRSLTLGPVSQTQPVLSLSLVLFVVYCGIVGHRGITLLGWFGALFTSLGVYATTYADIKRVKEVKKKADDTPPFKRRAAAWIVQQWKTSGIFASTLAALLGWPALHWEQITVSHGDVLTFRFFDLMIVSMFLCIMIACVDEITLKLKIRKTDGLGFIKRVITGTKEDPSLLRKFLLGGVLNAAALMLTSWAWISVPPGLMLSLRGLPIVGVSLWGYLVRKEKDETNEERKLTLQRMVGLAGVAIGTVLMVFDLFYRD